ncbi:MAG: ZrgA family zinc uptake protein, partial [Aeromonas veronii]
MKAVTLLLAAAAFGAHANHDEHESHSHGAHEHGHGHLNLVVDGDQLMIELQAPAADLVGFEHAAKSDEEKAQYAKAVARL